LVSDTDTNGHENRHVTLGSPSRKKIFALDRAYGDPHVIRYSKGKD
jgi:hypothetical protein